MAVNLLKKGDLEVKIVLLVDSEKPQEILIEAQENQVKETKEDLVIESIKDLLVIKMEKRDSVETTEKIMIVSQAKILMENL